MVIGTQAALGSAVNGLVVFYVRIHRFCSVLGNRSSSRSSSRRRQRVAKELELLIFGICSAAAGSLWTIAVGIFVREFKKKKTEGAHRG